MLGSPVLEFVELVSTLDCVMPALEGRRGGSEKQQGSFHPASHGSQGSRVIARRVSLLVAAVVLLVDNDHTQVLERREHGRARADCYPLPTLPQRPPGVVSLPR